MVQRTAQTVNGMTLEDAYSEAKRFRCQGNQFGENVGGEWQTVCSQARRRTDGPGMCKPKLADDGWYKCTLCWRQLGQP